MNGLTDPQELTALAEHAGIEPFYWDIWGNRRETSDETRQALLAAMGFAVATPAETAASRAAFEAAAWCTLLPPVVVLREGDPFLLPLRLPDAWAQAIIDWQMETEDGTLHTRTTPLTAAAVGEHSGTGDQAVTRLDIALDGILPLPPTGYHTLRVHLHMPAATRDVLPAFPQQAACRLILAPRRAPAVPLRPDGQNPCGISVQVYALRSEQNWGVGDLADLTALVRLAAANGADLVGINPLHALFLADPAHISPYSPSHRQFLNPLYLAIPAMVDFAESAAARAYGETPAFQAALKAARTAEKVDWTAVHALKLPVLKILWEHFRTAHLTADPSGPRATAFRAFQAEQGVALTHFALFETLHGHFYSGDPSLWSWHDWPAPFQGPTHPDVAAFAATHADTLAFHQYLQWQTALQLAAAADAARAAGMVIGLYRDLAVAEHPGGAAAWSRTATVLPDVNVGAPPDAFSPLGQNWGLSPLSPLALQENAYAPFISALRANLRHAGALRIDHVMGLWHLFWIPAGRWQGLPGTYVRYPFADLFRILALEASRHHTVLIGEDLGTVPEGFRPAMAEAAILSYKVLYFERHYEGRFNPSFWYPEQALVTATTHDLPTLRGFWEGRDLAWRDRLGQYPSPEARQEAENARLNDRWKLLDALRNENLLPADLHGITSLPPFSRDLALAICRWLARTPCRIRMLPIEDVLGEAEQPNLPGTVDTHPNWCRRLGESLETLATSGTLKPFLAALAGREPGPGC